MMSAIVFHGAHAPNESSDKWSCAYLLLAPGTGERIKVRGQEAWLAHCAFEETLTLPSPLKRERGSTPGQRLHLLSLLEPACRSVRRGSTSSVVGSLSPGGYR
jgi:hypothetical protein